MQMSARSKLRTECWRSNSVSVVNFFNDFALLDVESHSVYWTDPDRWRSDSDHGLAKEEAQEKFKEIQNAYDHLMSRFDNDYDY